MDAAAGERRVQAGGVRLSSRGRMAVAIGAALVVAAIVFLSVRASRASEAARLPAAWTPLPHQVRIEVRNASGAAGAARTGTQILRHAGLDVVQSGNPETNVGELVQNRILVRRGDTTGVGRIIEALGGAEVIDMPDSTRRLDLTVFLGKKFSPPPDRFLSSP